LEDGIKVQTLIDRYENFITASWNARKKSERCRDYYDNKQLTDEEIATYEKRKQPIIINNRIKVKVDFTLGLERQIRTDPKAFPRTPKHDDDAASATDAIRYVMDKNVFNQKRSRVHKNLQIEGTGGYELNVKPGKDGFNISVNYLHWDRMYWDEHSRLEDFEDAKEKGIVIWMDYVDGIAKFGKDKAEILEAGYDYDSDDTYEDKPSISWGDKTRKRIKICYSSFLHDGTWHYAYFNRGGFIVEPQESPFLDEDGKPMSNLFFQSAFVDREGNRYGSVEQLIGLQDEINKRRSKFLHLTNVRQTYGNKRSFGSDGPSKAKRELHKPDGHVEIEFGEYGKDFGVLPTNDIAANQFTLLQEAKEEIDAHGVNSAMSGKETRNMSGRALIQRSQQSSTEIGPIFDGLRALDLRIYRATWMMIRQFWKEEKWLRVTDDEENIRWVGINKPVTMADKVIEQFGAIPPEFENDPRLSQVVEVKNQPAKIDVDIIIDDMPDTVNIQQEQFDIIASLASTRPDVPLSAVVKLSQIRDKEKFMESISGTDEEKQQQAEAGQAKMQLDMEEKQADIRGKNAKAAESESKAALNEAEINQMLNAPFIEGQFTEV